MPRACADRGHELREDGSATFAAEVLAGVAQLPFRVRRLLPPRRGVYARLGRVTWEGIGNAMDVTHQSAQERFKTAVGDFQDQLFSPENPDYTGSSGSFVGACTLRHGTPTPPPASSTSGCCG